MDNLPLSCYDFTVYGANNKIIGEKALLSMIAIGLSTGEHANVLGPAGSGKTYITDTIIKLMPEKDVCEIGQISDQAIWKLVDTLDQYKIIYFPEFQKITTGKPKNNSIVELVKTIAEGKDATKIVTIGSKAVELKIPKGKTIITGKATENSYEQDTEIFRRFTNFTTDSSKKHIENILDDKLKNSMNLNFNPNHENLEERLKNRIKETMDLTNTYVINPFAESLKEYIPIVNKTQSYIDKYLNMMNGFGKFFAPERTTFQIEDKNIVILNFEDVYNVFDMYDKHFKDSLRIFNEGEEILDTQPDWNKIMDSGLKSLKNDVSIGINGKTIKLGEHSPKLIDNWYDNQTIDEEISFIDYKTGNYITPLRAETIFQKVENFYPLMKI